MDFNGFTRICWTIWGRLDGRHALHLHNEPVVTISVSKVMGHGVFLGQDMNGNGLMDNMDGCINTR